MRLQAVFVVGSQAPGGELVPPNQELAVTVEPVSPALAGEALAIANSAAAAAIIEPKRIFLSRGSRH